MSDRRAPPPFGYGYPAYQPYPGYPPPPMGFQPPGAVHYPGYHLSYPYPHAPMPIAPPADVVFGETIVIGQPEVIGEPQVVELPWRAYRWVPASTYSMPPGALHVGTDQDGAEIFAGRANHEGDVIPAKVIPSKNACYICFNGEEVLKQHFEVLCPATFAWQFSTGGAVPPGAVEVGTTGDGEKLYLGRVTHDGCQTPGKIHPSHEVCYYPFDGEEKSSAEYEVLVFQ